jgi:hypothetical protein
MKEIYLYPAFESGIVEYNNGKRYKSNLNYNKVVGSVQFIDEKGDTLSLADEKSISNISVGTDNFYYTPVCIRQFSGNSHVKLLKNELVRIADKQKIGGYGIPNTGGTIESVGKSDIRTKIDVNEALLLRKTTTYYFGNEDNKFAPATRKNVLALFPKHENSLKDYLNTHPTEFNKEEDLIKLTEFIGKL